jgi:hypothetical protein
MDTDEAFNLQRDDKESKRSSLVGVLANFLRLGYLQCET